MRRSQRPRSRPISAAAAHWAGMQSGDDVGSQVAGVTSRLRRQMDLDAAIAAAAAEDADNARVVHSRRVIIPQRPQLAVLRAPAPLPAPEPHPHKRIVASTKDRHTALALVCATTEASRAAANTASSAAFVVWWREFMTRHIRRAARSQRERAAAARASQLAEQAAAKTRRAALARQAEERLARAVAVRAVVREAQRVCDRAEVEHAQRRKRVREVCSDADQVCARAAQALAEAERRQCEWWQSTDRGRAWADAWKRRRVAVAEASLHTAGATDGAPDVTPGGA